MGSFRQAGSAAGTAFHARVARAAHTGAIELLAACLREPLLLALGRAGENAAFGDGEEGLHEHAAFVDAVAGRDTEAVAVVDRHLRRVLSHLSRTDGEPAGAGPPAATARSRTLVADAATSG